MATPTESTVYSVIIKDQYDCADTLHSNIVVNPLPVVSIHPDDTVIKYGQSLQLNGSGAFLYHWYPSSAVSNTNLSNPIAYVTRPVTIILSGFDEKGCVNTDSIRIDVDYKDQTFIPTAFSPNGDGKNDLFKVGSISFQKLLEFRIFNRWGQEVFTTTDPQQGWDGKYKGVLQDVGTYHYIIRVAYPDSRVETFKGDVTLVK
jgi:gliding motility-associated-like protein